ncbi:ASCH domain-containing protein (plasmid) [Enterobacter hormaechei]|uniref:ASCH domain-containing protein n=1 Tax=Enterobacter hormaechei TaxID=158836 RepID=UPI002B4BC638|nr:ASCH domain-containing protein [Enterobacter hormaechei]WRM07128.1 ASCH domain-containing protein [Enterobacter hormaechei]
MTERVLQLAIEGEYFQAILDGEKTQEFRLSNDYWQRRISCRTYDKLVLTWGYPSKTDKKRRIEMPWTGYEFIPAMKHKHFGDEPVAVFAINIAPREQWIHDPALSHKKA